MSITDNNNHPKPLKVRSRTAIWHDMQEDKYYLLKKNDGKIKETFKNGQYIPSFNPQISGIANAKQRMRYAEKNEEFSASRPKSLHVNPKQMYYTPQADKYDGYAQQPSPKSPPYFNIMHNPKLRELTESMVQIKPKGIEKHFNSELNHNVYNPPTNNCSYISGTVNSFQDSLKNNTIQELDYNKQKTIIRKRNSNFLSDKKVPQHTLSPNHDNNNNINNTYNNNPKKFKIINGKILTIPNQSIMYMQKQKEQTERIKASQMSPNKTTNVSFTYNPKEKSFTAQKRQQSYGSNDLSAMFGQTQNSVLENSFISTRQYSNNNLNKQWSRDRSMNGTNSTETKQSTMKFSDQTNISVSRYNAKVRHRDNTSPYLRKDASNENILNNSLYEEYEEIRRSNSNLNINKMINNSSQYLTKTFSKLEIIPDEEPQPLVTSQSFVQKMQQNKMNQEASKFIPKVVPQRIITKGRFPKSRAISPGEMYLKECLLKKQMESLQGRHEIDKYIYQRRKNQNLISYQV